MHKLVFLIISGLLISCASDETYPTPQKASTRSNEQNCSIEGAYIVAGTRSGGSCGQLSGVQEEVTVTMQKMSDTQFTAYYPGVKNGCLGKLNGCTWTSACEFYDEKGQFVGSASLSWIFTYAGFTGTESWGLHSPIVSQPCTADYNDIGTKK